LGPFHFEEFSFGSACTQLINKNVHFVTHFVGDDDAKLVQPDEWGKDFSIG
jgi:hypothetical protein